MLHAALEGGALEEVVGKVWPALVKIAAPSQAVSADELHHRFMTEGKGFTLQFGEMEKLFGCKFPTLHNGPKKGKTAEEFAENASDAAGIALWGARQAHPSLSYAAPVSIDAPEVVAVASAGRKRGRDECDQ